MEDSDEWWNRWHWYVEILKEKGDQSITSPSPDTNQAQAQSQPSYEQRILPKEFSRLVVLCRCIVAANWHSFYWINRQ